MIARLKAFSCIAVSSRLLEAMQAALLDERNSKLMTGNNGFTLEEVSSLKAQGFSADVHSYTGQARYFFDSSYFLPVDICSLSQQIIRGPLSLCVICRSVFSSYQIIMLETR